MAGTRSKAFLTIAAQPDTMGEAEAVIFDIWNAVGPDRFRRMVAEVDLSGAVERTVRNMAAQALPQTPSERWGRKFLLAEYDRLGAGRGAAAKISRRLIPNEPRGQESLRRRIARYVADRKNPDMSG